MNTPDRWRTTLVSALVATLAVDLASKLAARWWLSPDGHTLLPGVVLRVFENTRGPFGIGPLWFALLAGLGALAVLVHPSQFRTHPTSLFELRGAGPTLLRLRGARNATRALGLGLLLGGGVANVGERVLVGHTTDLIVLGATTALNAADVAIVFGLVLLFWPRWSAGQK